MRSMTGYGRGESADGDSKFVVELSSVNRKQKEVIVNLPRKLSTLEMPVRKEIAKGVSRGRVTVQVSVESTHVSHGTLEADEALARQYRDALDKLANTLGQPLDLAATDLIRAPGVFSLVEAEVEVESAWPALESAIEAALGELLAMHEREGAHLAEDIDSRLGTLKEKVVAVKALGPEVVESQRASMHRRLNDAGLEIPLDDERLVREIALFAERCDITEETTRLESHLIQFTRYLESDEPVGRAMDFLCQEVFRELNTIGAKANNAAIAQHVVDGKTELEKVREQVQNVQ